MSEVAQKTPPKRNNEYFLGLAEQLLDGLRMEAAARDCFNLEYEIKSLIERLRQRPDQTVIPATEKFVNTNS